MENGRRLPASTLFDPSSPPFFPRSTSTPSTSQPFHPWASYPFEAIRGKSKWWADNHTVHKAEVSGPYPHDDRFAVRFVFDFTHKPSGKRTTMDEVALFTVKNDKITREEFFYTSG